MPKQRWLEVAIVVCVITLILGLLLPAMYRAQDAADRMASKNNLRLIGLALQSYHDTHGFLPAGGEIDEDETPTHGWLIQTENYLSADPYDNLFHRVSKFSSWDDSENRYYLATPVKYFLVPGVEDNYSSTGYALTHYQGNPNLLHRNSPVAFDQMQDGQAQAWMAGEVVGHFQPWDYPFNWRSLGEKLCSGPESFGRPEWQGGHLLFADGHVAFFSDQTSPEVLKRFGSARPVATDVQTAGPGTVFQTGKYHWDYLELSSEPEDQSRVVAHILRNSAEMPLLMNVYFEKYVSSEALHGALPGLTVHVFLCNVDEQSDVAEVLNASELSNFYTPLQMKESTRKLEAVQQQLPKTEAP
ncbi:DUF1559 family PulG-like putative transporter [Gimesia panareensis]|uniref:DUF1559 family PulG-like putative transporter n=1 Tax=Gimesia panareensis TaxID=2527978 RepID=UPI00118C5681|nr:DUF1559 domain-containing protein [Gimesia panareensis]QDU48503.1 hypothetical protein Pan110_08180 [Gimesia panareensis]